MASTNAKPDGMLLIPRPARPNSCQMMPLRVFRESSRLWRSGFNAKGVYSVAELAQLDEAALTRYPGPGCGTWITGGLARVGFPRNYHGTRGEIHWVEETLAEDTRDMRVVCGLLRSACDEVTSALQAQGLVARTLTGSCGSPT